MQNPLSFHIRGWKAMVVLTIVITGVVSTVYVAIGGVGTVTITPSPSVIFEDDFDPHGDFSKWTGVAGGLEITTAVAHHGVYAARAVKTNNNNVYAYKAFTAQYGVVYVTACMWFTVLPSSSPETVLRLFGNDVHTSELYVRVMVSANRWEIGGRDDSGAWWSGTWLTTVSLNTWYVVKIKAEHSSSASFKLYVNDVERISVEGKDVNNKSGIQRIYIGGMYLNWGSITNIFDCVSVSTSEIEIPHSPPSPPSWSALGHNTTDAGAPVKFHVKWTDPDGLSGYIFSWNGTGTWTNSTFVRWSGSPTSAWSNVTQTLPSIKDVVVGYRFYANETNKGWASTSIGTLVTTKPAGWEETVLTLGFEPSDPPLWNSSSMWYTIRGNLRYLNGSGIEGSWLKVYIGYGDTFNLVGIAQTYYTIGEYSFTFIPPIGKGYESNTVKFTIRVVYDSDRPWTLGASVERTVIW